ncbi:hypothetical protein Droror1_Dr00022089 [Drosera rotundifolia]
MQYMRAPSDQDEAMPKLGDLSHHQKDDEECRQQDQEVTPIGKQIVALGAISNRSDRFDVIITACEEQDMDFVTFLSRIRTINDEIPIFVMLPEMDEQKTSRAQISGANFFLDKPISDHDVKYLWQHVTRTRKMIAEDKALRVTGERRGNKEMGSTLKIIDHDVRQNPRKFDWLMSNTSEHSVSDPKGKRKMVALGHELHFMDPIHMPRTRGKFWFPKYQPKPIPIQQSV